MPVPLPRLLAAELEAAVLAQLRSILRSGDGGRRGGPGGGTRPTLDEAQVTVAMTRLRPGTNSF